MKELNYVPKGELEGFPIEVINKMLERQYEQTGEKDVSVFEIMPINDKPDGGFNWSDTKEGFSFWNDVIDDKDWDIFFKLYPKIDKNYPRKMIALDEKGKKRKEVIVLGECELKTSSSLFNIKGYICQESDTIDYSKPFVLYETVSELKPILSLDSITIEKVNDGIEIYNSEDLLVKLSKEDVIKLLNFLND